MRCCIRDYNVRRSGRDPSRTEQVSRVPLHSDACPQFFRREDVARKFDVPEFNLELESELLNSGGVG